MLGRLLVLLGFAFSPWFLAVTLAAGTAGLFLALRQWDAFGASFLHFLTLEGAALAVLSLVLSKALHELGHGLTAKRLGCRVPTMGIAVMVLYPMPYTDTSEAWRLRARGQRMAVAAAGIAAELMLACWALLAWSFLPEGPLRSVAFTWATTTWVLTLLVNLSPFMRFDGYYLLSDALDVPNLQDRAFALARWRIREALFGLGEAPPEAWPPRMRRLLLAWAVCTWAYRLVLFLGIALLVYHLFFKALGILLFAIEIWWFILRPVWREAVQWARRRHAMRLNRNTLATGGAMLLLLGAILLPWHGTVEAPALLAAERRTELFAQVPARVARIAAAPGTWVEAGAPVLVLESPDLAFRLRQAARRVETLTWQATFLSQERDWAARSQILWRELQAARAELDALRAEEGRMQVAAPFAGTVVEVAEPLGAGEWVRAGERLAALADLRASVIIEAWVEEAALRRIAPGQAASFVPEDPGAPRLAARVLSVDGAAARVLPDRELASLHGGAIATRPGPNGAAVPELPVYRVLLAPIEPLVARRVTRGVVLLQGEAESFAARLWRQALGVALRESGF
jgi:putative peptide zinc metalloprotease protein